MSCPPDSWPLGEPSSVGWRRHADAASSRPFAQASSVASWITALLFALLPLRNSLPGSPPLGSWIDILMYFWVVAVVMVSLAFVTGLLLTRAKGPVEEDAGN
jgi:hypothetical protein